MCMFKLIQKNALSLAWLGALVATVGSMIFSEVLKFPPCVLCWYQRAMMYPLVAIIGVAIYKKDRNILIPAFILIAIGWLISVYHNLLYYKIIPESAAPCIAGISCTTKYIEWFGFVTIPFLAFAGFTSIFILLTIYWRTQKNDERN